jgi:hypothetical protein
MVVQQISRLIAKSDVRSIAETREVIRCLAVCPDLNSEDAVRLGYQWYRKCEDSELTGAMVEVYVRRGYIDHALTLASDSNRSNQPSEVWNSLVHHAARSGDVALLSCVWQQARSKLLIEAMATAGMQERSAAMVIASLTEGLKHQVQFAPETIKSIEGLVEETESTRVRNKIRALLNLVSKT